ncbi:uncharacterized protein RJT20DRAFT_117703 [Scheffersomyces xylosifermentans]|uniref:uncharacterized protein n=1 Tax=Scheffersomyces xylosifermentans TaxID=1304137 RepID=UPI00315DD38C
MDNYDYGRGANQSPFISNNNNNSNNSNNAGVNPAPGQPATPRMLRSVSGTLKNSRSELISNTSHNRDRSQDYSASNEHSQQTSHARTPSYHQQQLPLQPLSKRSSVVPAGANAVAAAAAAANAAPGSVTPVLGHSKTPSSSRPQPPSTPGQTTNRKELLSPAAIPSPAGCGPPPVSAVASTPQQTPREHSNSHQQSHSNQSQGGHATQQQFHRKSIGDWDFVKTIGAGSMGKVKLAQHNTTKEICAVKIIPRAAKLYQRAHANDPPPQTTQEAAQRHKEFDKEIARDKRTIREGALGRLLFHPFICRLYEMVPMTNHYYMLFEYVEGGQMLDYIVAHGSLKEKHARKFARGIASALDYCHKNNVVHRDLKIENIMINEKGDIKIIDFGLSNLYSPKTLLQTYCGSLYFAAPELLSAKPYTGPEVDVWSFGVVLYVLVCGKVPFDDQSVSVLHEKIKRGNVEYPNFLSRECVSLLSRMLVVDPAKRASLYEVCQHPWMNKGYEYKVSNYVPKRTPLTLPLDPEIIKTISSFDLGSVSHITEELTSVLTSVEYQMSQENWYKLTDMGRDYASASNSHILPDPTGGFHPLISIYYLVDEMRKRKRAKEAAKAQLQQQQQRQAEEQYLKKKQAEDEQTVVQQERSRQELPDLSFPEQAHTASIAPHRSSQSPVRDLEATTTSESTGSNNIEHLQAHPQHIPHHPHALSVTTPRETTPVVRDTLDPNAGKNSAAGFNSLLRRLSTKKKTPESPGTSGYSGHTEESNTGVPGINLYDFDDKLSPQDSASRRDPMVRRGVSMKVTAKEKSTSSRVNLHPSANTSSSNQPQGSDSPKIPQGENASTGTNSKKTHSRTPSGSGTGSGKQFHGFIPVEYLPPLPNINVNTNTIVPSNANSTSSNAATPSGNTAIGSSGRKLHPTARAKSVGGHIRKDSYNQRARANSQHPSHPPLPNTMAAQNSEELLNEPGSASNNSANSTNSTNNDGFFDDVRLDDVDYQEIPQLSEDQIIEQFNTAPPNSMPSIEHCKTLFLKGFFSVQTTSTKPLPVIRYNIINVLSKLGVKFQEVKGGFVCAHTPSVQQTPQLSIGNASIDDDATEHGAADDNDIEDITSEERKLYGDAFKSTSSSIDGEDQETVRTKTPEPETHLSTHSQSRTPSRQPSLHLQTQTLSPTSNTSSTTRSRRSSNSIGASGASGQGHRRKFSIGNSILGTYRKRNGSNVMMPPNTPATAKVAKGLYPDEEGEYDYDGREYNEDEGADDDSVDSLNGMMIGGGSDMLISSRVEHRARHQHSLSGSGSMSRGRKSPLKFEIHIVKVPLVGLYGVQFKKLLGNTWNYKTLAGQILNELNL